MSYVGSAPSPSVVQFSTLDAQSFNGDNSTTAFTLNRAVSIAASIEVTVNNVQQSPYDGSYTVNGTTTLTFSEAPSSGTDNIYVRFLDYPLASITPGDGTVGLDQLSATGTPSSSTYLRGDNSWAELAGFDSGTVMLFGQTSAPTGWTKDTTNYNNSGLRVVTGSASTGGSVDFTTAFASQAVAGTVGSYTLTTSDIPSHTHGFNGQDQVAGGGGGYSANRAGINFPNVANVVTATGGGGSHSHSFSGTAINLAVKYVDVIRATKD